MHKHVFGARMAWYSRLWTWLTDRPWRGVALALLVGLAVRLPLAFVHGYVGDIVQWGRLAQQATLGGLPRVYALVVENPGIGVYPPLYHYLLWVVGSVYRAFFSATFVPDTPTLSTLLKLVPILGDCLVGLAACFFVRALAASAGQRGRAAALGALVAVLINPAIIFNSAYWGMFGDPWYTLGLVVALAAAAFDRVALAWVGLTAAVLIKPQAAPLVPLIAWVSLVRPFLRRGALRWREVVSRWGRAAAAGLVTLLLVLLPFILAGRLPQVVQALRHTVGLFPILSANAHNVWWLFTLGNGWTSDVEPLLVIRSIGALTPRLVGMLAFGLVYCLALVRLGRPEEDERASPAAGWSLWLTAAYLSFAFYMLATEMHENYTYPALALLAAAWPVSRRTRALAVLLTITSLTTMILHDPPIQGSLEGPPYIALIRGTVGNSALNFVVFLAWTGMLIAHRRVARALRLGRARPETGTQPTGG